ncbi:MAG: N-acetylmuramoyl-L-alanine amidase [Smithellaceae bacterium]
MNRDLSSITKIIVHCSDSEFGDAALIDAWHNARGWAGIGYHYVILNGIIAKGAPYDPALDGKVQVGRHLTEIGAHVQGHNADSVGICLIGKHHFTGNQLLRSLPDLLTSLKDLPGITGWQNIFGHCEFDRNKTCPNLDMNSVRRMMA